MASTTEYEETTIRVLTFNGDSPEKWREWSIKTIAIAMRKKWKTALFQDCKNAAIDVSVLTTEQKAQVKMNDDAWSYLVMACEGLAFNLITSVTEGNAFLAYNELLKEFEPKNDDALVDVQEMYATCQIKNPSEDPSKWIDRLKIINSRLAGIDIKYKKSDVEVMAYVMANSPADHYDDVITVTRKSGISHQTLNDLRKDMHDKWCRLVKTKSLKPQSTSDEGGEALNVNDKTKKKAWSGSKRFKGNCRKCGKQGHKAANCWSGTGGSNEQNKGKTPTGHQNRKCYRCNKIGHIAVNCPDKDKETGLVAFVTTVNAKPSAWVCDDYDCVRTTDTDDCHQCKLCNDDDEWCFEGVAKEMDEANEWCFTGVASQMNEALVDDYLTDEMSILLTQAAQGDERISPHNTVAWVKDVKRKLKLIDINAVSNLRYQIFDLNEQLKEKGELIFHVSTLRNILDKALDDVEHRWADAEDRVVELEELLRVHNIQESNEVNHLTQTGSKFKVNKDDEEVFLLDSGATVNIVMNGDHAIATREVKTTITVGNGQPCNVVNEVDIELKEKGTGQIAKITAMVCPGFTKNILSLKKLMNNGYRVNFDDNEAKIINKSSEQTAMICMKNTQDGMFYLHGSRTKKESAYNAADDTAADNTTKLGEWTVVESKATKRRAKSARNLPKTLTRKEAHHLWSHKGIALIEKTAKDLGIQLTGTLDKCEGCGLAHAKQKAVSKTTNVVTTAPYQRIYADASGPFTPTIGGSKYWFQSVEEYGRMGDVEFAKKKNQMADFVKKVFEKAKTLGYTVKYLRCDNAGENVYPLTALCAEWSVTLELTAPDTPQQNGVVERRITVLRQRANAMMWTADLKEEARTRLWAEAVSMANDVENITCNTLSAKSAYEIVYKEKPKLIAYAVQFGRIGIKTLRQKFKKKWKERGEKILMVGYAADHSSDTYRVYHPGRKTVSMSRDITWLPWTYLDPKRDMSVFRTDPTLLTGIDDKEMLMHTPLPPRHLVLDDAPEPEARRIQSMDTSNSDTNEIPADDDGSGEDEANDDVSGEEAERNENADKRVEREMRRLTAYYNPTARDTLNEQLVTYRNQDGTEEERIVNFCFNAVYLSAQDFNTPTTLQEALNGDDREIWLPSVASELMNFIKRKCWKKVPRTLPNKLQRKIMNTMWMFKNKDEHDNTVKHKSRVCSKGFQMVPGVDYKESFSPVATETTVRVFLCVYLYYCDPELVITFVCEMIDIEAAFLEGDMEGGKPTFIDWPDGMFELGFIDEKDIDENCILLLKSMYGNVDAAIRFFRTYRRHLLEKMKLEQSQADPCVFFKKNAKGMTVLIAITHVDDTLLIGTREAVDEFKKGIKERFGYTDLGRMKKHLGVWYEHKTDKNGDTYLEATMPKYVKEIVALYEKHKGQPVKEYNTPGTPGISLEKNKGDSVEPEMYRRIVGKVMYLVTKIFPEGSNAARELSRQFGNPSEDHWNELGRFIGYLKLYEKDVKVTYRKPKELRVLSYVDSNYATNKDDRRSVSGAIHTLGGTITNWLSKTQESTTLSSCEAEYVSLASGAQEVKFVQMLLNEVLQCTTPGILMEDNTGAIYLVKNQQISARTKHIDIRWHFIRELYDRKIVTVKFVRSEDNPSDICTKNTPEKLQLKHANDMRNGTLDAHTKWESIIKEIENESVHVVLREDVKNRTHDWIGTGSRHEIQSGEHATLVASKVNILSEVYMVS